MSTTYNSSVMKSMKYNGYTVQTWIHDGVEVFRNSTPFYLVQNYQFVDPTKANWFTRQQYYIYGDVSMDGAKIGLYGNNSSVHGSCNFWSAISGGIEITNEYFTLNDCRTCEVIVSAMEQGNGGCSLNVCGHTITTTGTHTFSVEGITQGQVTAHLNAWYTRSTYIHIQSIRFY